MICPIHSISPIGSHCVPMGLMPYVVSFFVDFAARWAASPFRIKMLGMAKPFLRRGFACGKTLVRRKSGAALKGRWARFKMVRPKFEISRLAKKKDTMKACLPFWVPAARGRLHPSVFECSGEVNSPCAAGQKAGRVQLRYPAPPLQTAPAALGSGLVCRPVGGPAF